MPQRRVRLSAGVFAAFTVLAATAQAQVAKSLQVDVLAVDRAGRPVAGLGADDFELRHKGRLQKVVEARYVAPSDAPRTTVFVVDDIGMSFRSAGFVKQALVTFADEHMGAGDQVTVVRTYSTYSGTGTEHTLSADKKRLRQSIEGVRYNAMQRGRRTSAEDVRYEGSMFASLECLRAVVRDLGQVPGRKSVVFFSDGLDGMAFPFVDVAVSSRIDAIVEAANRASVVIYTVDARGLPTAFGAGWNMPRRQAEHWPLHNLAGETGGVFLWNTDVERALSRVMAGEGGYYVLRYEPAAAVTSKQPAEVQVKATRSGVKVRARTEVWAAIPALEGT